ncbi:hypothetical protein ACT6QH_10650 [Xanthobacter sp. TB0139]
MVKRIAVFAALVLGYAFTGMALNASQPGDAPATVTAHNSAAD